MAKPKSTDRQKVRAYKLWATLKFGPTAIHEALQEEFTGKGTRKPVSIDTVKKWIAEFKKLSTDLDQPFAWHRMEEYGISWEASGRMLLTWKAYITAMAPLYEAERRASPHPTVRQVRWWWRVYKSVSATDKKDEKLPGYLDIAIWGDNFAIREIKSEVLGHDPDFDDLFAYLAFRPWASNEAKSEYLEAIQQHLIPALQSKSLDLDMELIDRVIGGEDLDLDAFTSLPEIVMDKDDFPVLPSEWVAYTEAARRYIRKKAQVRTPMEQWLFSLLVMKEHLRLQGFDEDEVRRRIYERGLEDFWANDPDGDGFVRMFPLNHDATIEYIDHTIFREDQGQQGGKNERLSKSTW
ncbi:MAG: hypothetical protein HY666_05050 [Chloroflexi bacterium]|nr:hypothetical protein [Chloroflexota bacterium]